MKQYYPAIGLDRICRLFGRTRQNFYDHSWRNSTKLFQEAMVLDMVNAIRSDLPKIGGLKLHFMLKDQLASRGIAIGRDNFFKLLRKYNLLVKHKKRYVRTTWSSHPYKKWPDLIKGLELQAPERLWVSDITYLRLENGFAYLSLITDAYSKKIMGYHLSQHLKAHGCVIALNKAIKAVGSPQGIIHHSDRGIQYCCEEYVAVLQQHGLQISMTQNGSPYDNAVAERVNGILKNELALDRIFSTYREAVAALPVAINAYNNIRPHLSCSKLTPAKAHTSGKPLKQTWKTKKHVKLIPYNCETV
jgi:putative transposase